MRVGIDARILYYTRGGIARYGRGLIEALCRLTDRPDLELFFARKAGGEPNINGAQKVKQTRWLSPPHFRFEEPFTAAELARTKIDLLHGIDFFVPTLSRTPQVLTVHDLYFLRDPSILSPESLRHYRKILKYIPSAAHVLCDSKATMNDLLEFTGCRPDRCSVVYPGIESAWWSEKSANGLPVNALGPYLLIVSTLEPRKNIPKTLEAYAEARIRIGAIGLGAHRRLFEDLVELGRALLGGELALEPRQELADLVEGNAIRAVVRARRTGRCRRRAEYRGCFGRQRPAGHR